MSSSSSSSSSLPIFKSGRMITACAREGGLSVDMCSSAVQKCLRRGQADLAVAFAKEWLLFREWHEDTGRAAAILSNFRNRVFHVMPFEDVLAFTEIPLLLLLQSEMDKRMSELIEAVRDGSYHKEGEQSKSRWTGLFLQVLNGVRILVDSTRKCRLGSDMRYHFGRVEGLSTVLSEKGMADWSSHLTSWIKSVNEDSAPLFPMLFKVFDVATSSNSVLSPELRKQVLACRKSFWTTLEEGAKKFKQPLLTQWIRRCRELFQLHSDSKESFLYPLHALLAVVHRQRIPLEPIDEELLVRGALVPSPEDERAFQEDLYPTPPKVPDYCIDMHTSEGRRLGKGKAEFAHEGSWVAKEDTEFLNPQWRQEYIQSKMDVTLPPAQNKKKRKGGEEEGGAEEKKEPSPVKKSRRSILSFVAPALNWKPTGTLSSDLLKSWKSYPERLVLCQRATSKWKQITLMDYIGRDSPNGKWIYKGPFDLSKGNTTHRLNTMAHRTKLFRSLGVRCPKTELLSEEGSGGQRVWMRMENLAGPVEFDQLRFESKEEDGEMMCNDWRGRVLDRSSSGIVRANDITEQEWAEHPDACRQMVLYLFLRTVTLPPIGDNGPWNLLVRRSDWTVWMIDYEEESHVVDLSTPFTAENWVKCINKRPFKESMTKAVNSLLGMSGLESKNRTSFVQAWRVYYERILGLEDEQKALIHHFQVDRINKFIVNGDSQDSQMSL